MLTFDCGDNGLFLNYYTCTAFVLGVCGVGCYTKFVKSLTGAIFMSPRADEDVVPPNLKPGVWHG